MRKKTTYINQLIKQVMLLIFLEPIMHFFQDSLMNRNRIYVNQKSFATNIYTVTFDQFNASSEKKMVV